MKFILESHLKEDSIQMPKGLYVYQQLADYSHLSHTDELKNI